jgi:hypothetical protein
MRPHHSSILLAWVVSLLALSGCQTPQPSGGGAGGGQSSGSAGSSSTPSSESTPPASPDPMPTSSSSTPSTSGSADTQSSQSTRTATTENSGSAEPGGAQTPEERRTAIDRRLDSTLGTFDEEIRKEQERVAKERDARDATTASTEGTESDAEKEGEGEAGSAETENPTVANSGSKPGESNSRPGDLKSDRDRAGGSNSGAASGTGATAQNIPDGSDDDIVARRLRKAAEQETDPELKDKLWKEYIEYKKNAGTRG